MTALGGSRVAARNYVLIRLTSLASWGKCINPYKFSNETLGGHQHQVTKCQQWNKSSSTRYFVTGSSVLCRNCINKSQGWFLNPKKAGEYNVVRNFSSRPSTFSEQKMRGKEALLGTFSSQKIRNFASIHSVQIFRLFHGSSPLNAAPVPILLMILKPAQKLLAIILGRSIRKWWSALPPNKRELFKESVRRNKWKIVLGLCSLGVIFIMFYFTHLEETPITGRARLLVFGKEHFAELSQFEYNMWVEEFKDKMLPETDPRYQVVEKAVLHLAESNKDLPQVSEFKWTIHVVEEPGINAFVLPNGQVFVFTGLLTAVSDLNQLSFILGHEIAHAVLGHAAEKASLVHFLDFLSLIILTMIWAACPRDSLAILGQWIQARFQELLFDRPYNRTLEAEADKVGLQFAAKACMDVRASTVFWQQMELAETIQGHPKVPQWLSTHPSHENRAEHLDRLIPEATFDTSVAQAISISNNFDTEVRDTHTHLQIRTSCPLKLLDVEQESKYLHTALKIRERCNCPALSGQDPRLIFKLSMQHLLQVSKDEEVPNVAHHDLHKVQVNPLFINEEKRPGNIGTEKGWSR